MKLVKQSYEILEQEIPVHKLDDYSGSHFREQYLENMYKHIERCGRTCYKSENKITPDSSKKFVDGLIKSKHLSVLEHGTIYLYIPVSAYDSDLVYHVRNEYVENPYSKAIYIGLDDDEPPYHDILGNPATGSMQYVITTNFRVLVENNWLDDLKYLCEPTKYHELRHTVLLHSCIHTYKDLTRHRKMSFSIESTRYCNYSKTDKFGEMKFVLPPWLQEPWMEKRNDLGIYTYWEDKDPSRLGIMPPYDDSKELLVDGYASYFNEEEYVFLTTLLDAEKKYNKLISLGWQPQQAAEVLPQCTAADVIMSGFDEDWKFIFDLRSDTALTGKPHPLVEELMTPLRDKFKANNWI
jgi:thymidylate synthase (FAD)